MNHSHESTIRPIAYIHTDLPTKFGLPRQSGLVPQLRSTIVMEPLYRDPVAFRGIEGFSHLWLIWGFSGNKRDSWAATVKPPRLGGNKRMGVFATRSPYRPNPIGLSSVKLLEVVFDNPEGPLLRIGGADLMDGTPILDVKPYLPYADSRPDATGGFTDAISARVLRAEIPEELLRRVPEEKREPLREVLEQDPRPSYQDDPERIYGFGFAGMEVRFRASNGVLTVLDIRKDN